MIREILPLIFKIVDSIRSGPSYSALKKLLKKQHIICNYNQEIPGDIQL